MKYLGTFVILILAGLVSADSDQTIVDNVQLSQGKPKLIITLAYLVVKNSFFLKHTE